MPQGDPPIPLNAEQRRVAAMLLNLARRCREAILNPTGKTDAQRSWHASQAAMRLRSIEQDLQQFNRSLARTVPAAMQSHFDRGLTDANKQLREAKVLVEGEPIRGSFAQVDSGRAQALVRDTADDLAKAGKTTLDQTRRTVRDIHALGLDGKEIRTIIAGGTIDGQPKAALAAIRKRAQAVADKDGRLWVVNRNGEAMSFDPRSYADMVFQTGSAEAANIATLERLDSKGIKYVKIIGSNSANFCTAFVDKVYYTGSDDDPQGLYPHIRELPDGGPPFHPRCTKRYAAFVVGLKTPAEIEAGKPDAATEELHGQSRNEAQKKYTQRERIAPKQLNAIDRQYQRDRTRPIQFRGTTSDELAGMLSVSLEQLDRLIHACVPGTDGVFKSLTISRVSERTISVESYAGQGSMHRRIRRDSSNNLVVEAAYFRMPKDRAGGGAGTRIFYEMARGLAAQGVHRIEMLAARGKTFNGYYTWPRLGYNAPLSALDYSVKRALSRAGVDVEGADLLDLMSDPAGRELWKTVGDSAELEFDLRGGSKCWAVLQGYLEEKGIRDE